MTEKPFTIIVDTREQLPYSFDGITAADGSALEVPTIRRALRSGDYAPAGLEDRCAVERKSLSDLMGVIGQGRARFQREIERLGEYDHASIVVEASFADMLGPRNPTQLHPSAIVASLVAWGTRFNIGIWFAGGRYSAERLTYRILERFWRDVRDGKRPAARDKAIAGIPANGGFCK